MDYKELKEENSKLKIEIEAFHLFQEDFIKYDLAINNGNALVVDMYSKVMEAKKKGNNTYRVIKQESRLKHLLSIFEMLQGLNNRCHSQKLLIKHKSQDEFYLRQKIEKLEKEISAIKMAHNQV